MTSHLHALAPYWPVFLTLVGYPLITAVLNWWLWWDTPAHWDAFVARQPRAAFAVRVLRAVGPHLRKLVVGWRDYSASKSASPPVVLPPVPTPPSLPRDDQRGSISLRALVGLLCTLVCLALACVGCRAVREAVLAVAPGVPTVVGCDAGAQSCEPFDGGAVPVVCSASGRFWPTLPRAADGTQRVCPAGCEVDDAGIASCAAPDGGAR